MTDRDKTPLKRFQEMLSTLLSVPKEELDEALEAEKFEEPEEEPEEREIEE